MFMHNRGRETAVRKQKIYLETTLFNYYFDEDRGIMHDSTVALFNEIAGGKYEAFTSRFVIDELNNASEEKRDKMFSLILEHDIPILETSDEVMRITDIYIEEKITPQKYRTDGLHIAIATVHDLDMIISLNFQHIVKRKTKIGTGNINALNGYRAVEIYSPMEILEDEND
jgi:predicted nucleic acid-binding protein